MKMLKVLKVLKSLFEHLAWLTGGLILRRQGPPPDAWLAVFRAANTDRLRGAVGAGIGPGKGEMLDRRRS
jgi:hypothetical protein